MQETKIQETKIIAEKCERFFHTIATKYEKIKQDQKGYQSEKELENELIAQLCTLGYTRAEIHNFAALKANLRAQIERLNGVKFSDAEWERFYIQRLKNGDLAERTALLQDPNKSLLDFEFDDGVVKNLALIDKNDLCKNHLQVINQYTNGDEISRNRYDVVLLVNGLPLVLIELKRRGVALREAFNQNERYTRECLESGSDGLFLFAQIFIISNGTHTRYYSNSTHFVAKRNFAFAMTWSDEANTPINDLVDFAATFLLKRNLLAIICRYSVFDTEKNLRVMRPYQIAAVEKILNKIQCVHNLKAYGSKDSRGFIWHTTGSGKTLTSFKVAQLIATTNLAAFLGIKKVLFVVDRKDLDDQTIREYNKFQEGAASGTENTAALRDALADENKKIIVTTIQKLSIFIKSSPKSEIFGEEVVIIFDECHRSQFGEMHKKITKAFKKYYLFGFTGTPIFGKNDELSEPEPDTTRAIFGNKLHTYSIKDAIRDHNVLPFKIDYINTIATLKNSEECDGSEALNADKENILKNPERIKKITSYVLEHFNKKTSRNANLPLNLPPDSPKDSQRDSRRENGFNALFATASIECAKLYYDEFRRQQNKLDPRERLRIAVIFSASARGEKNEMDEENNESAEGLSPSDRDFLASAIRDYNADFKSNFDASMQFRNYYSDVSQRLKNRELDLLIVVNMFLTGFDAPSLGALFVDKNLRMHGLLQAFSRTNRILNDKKSHGNVICFRNLDKQVDESIIAFGNDKNAGIIVKLRSFLDYLNGFVLENGEVFKGYKELVLDLRAAAKALEESPTNENKRNFIETMGAVLRLENTLLSFDEFKNEREKIISEREMQDIKSSYNDLREEFIRQKRDGESDGAYIGDSLNDDLVFELELLKSTEVDIAYILNLIANNNAKDEQEEEKLRRDIERLVDSSPSLRSKKGLFLAFLEKSNMDKNADFAAFCREEYEKSISAAIKELNLNDDQTRKFMHRCFEKGAFSTLGSSFTDILNMKISFEDTPAKEESTQREKVKAVLEAMFETYIGLRLSA